MFKNKKSPLVKSLEFLFYKETAVLMTVFSRIHLTIQ